MLGGLSGWRQTLLPGASGGAYQHLGNQVGTMLRAHTHTHICTHTHTLTLHNQRTSVQATPPRSRSWDGCGGSRRHTKWVKEALAALLTRASGCVSSWSAKARRPAAMAAAVCLTARLQQASGAQPGSWEGGRTLR